MILNPRRRLADLGRRMGGGLFLLLAAGNAGCGGGTSDTTDTTAAIMLPVQLTQQEVAAEVTALLEKRASKDQSFLRSPESPLAEEYRRSFQGLSYYPPNLKYRFKGPIHKYAQPEQFQIMSNTGELRGVLRWGYFRFSVDGKNAHTLHVYKMLDLTPDQSHLLFLPFMDSQAGRETYGSGRYLDLVEKEGGEYTIDFNAAYNPFCAFGKGYSCPMTPRENRLKISIPAGEKSFMP